MDEKTGEHNLVEQTDVLYIHLKKVTLSAVISHTEIQSCND